jgi:four helix bundle protein
VRDFRELKVWEKSHQLTLAIYKVTTDFPREEVYGLTSQIRRACASIPANIAEGCGRNSVVEFARFLHIAMGSASELDYHLMLARDLGYLNRAVYEHLAADLTEIKRMLGAYIQKIKAEHR